MADYSTESDLEITRGDILDVLSGTGTVFVVTDFQDRAAEIVDRDLVSYWYRDEATDREYDYTETTFDRDKLLSVGTELRNLHVFKTIELIMMHEFSRTTEESGFEREMKYFARRYADELKDVLAHGISYDWDDDASLASDEKYQTGKRRIHRC